MGCTQRPTNENRYSPSCCSNRRSSHGVSGLRRARQRRSRQREAHQPRAMFGRRAENPQAVDRLEAAARFGKPVAIEPARERDGRGRQRHEPGAGRPATGDAPRARRAAPGCGSPGRSAAGRRNAQPTGFSITSHPAESRKSAPAGRWRRASILPDLDPCHFRYR